MTSKERHEARYQRRKKSREQKRTDRSDAIGGVAEVFSFNAMFRAGKTCCNGVRWKNSTQRFELHLFSGTAARRKQLLDGAWQPSPYSHFAINERGKTRIIDAPKIQDRQVHKVYTKRVLLPLYQPQMIYNNGASVRGKGLHFSQELVKRYLRSHFKRYGLTGKIILLDFRAFFPSASHEIILERHEALIYDEALRRVGDIIVGSTVGDGLPLGVETSQVEMVAYPANLDNHLQSQLSLGKSGHYMDDYIIMVPPHIDAKMVLESICNKVKNLGLSINTAKTRIIPFGKPFRYCKARYLITAKGGVRVTCNKDSVPRDRRKLKAFRRLLAEGKMKMSDVSCAVNAVFAYLDRFNNHRSVLKLRRLFYALFEARSDNQNTRASSATGKE